MKGSFVTTTADDSILPGFVDPMRAVKRIKPTSSVVPPELINRLMSKVDAEGMELLGAILKRALDEERTAHLGYMEGDPAGRGSGNSRNGTSPKTVLTDLGAVTLKVPRDRNGTFEPQIVPKHARRLEGFNDSLVMGVQRRARVRLGPLVEPALG